MHLVIVESPAKCKSIKSYLGKDYEVLASYGHIRDLPSKPGSVEPEADFKMHYQVSTNAKKNLKNIEDTAKKAESLILATDPDREGEAISWHVLEHLRSKRIINKDFPVKRVSFNSITKKAVNEAMENPRDVDMDLVNSQQARRALDYLVGFTLSPILWRKLPGSRSAGRVQSVALRLICEREKEIEKFIPEEYWSIEADFLNVENYRIKTSLIHSNGKKLDKLSIDNKQNAQEILSAITGVKFSVNDVQTKQTLRRPKPPFITSTLQQEASRKLGFSASKTMTIAQKLYEGINIGGTLTGLITYMRTDGTIVAPEAISACRDYIGKDFGSKYLPEKPNFYASKAKNAQEAHEAIRPTDFTLSPAKVAANLEKDQLALYRLIWNKMVASQMTPAIFDQATIDIADANKKYIFRATGSVLKFDGFLRTYNEGKGNIDASDGDDADSILPEVAIGDNVLLADNFLKSDEEKQNPYAEQHFTAPPPRYNEASIVKRMEELGIGRPSTYASIISILIDRGYVKLESRRFMPEIRGRLVTEFLTEFFKKYVEYDFTAELEESLDVVSDGKKGWKDLLKQFWVDFKKNIDEASELRIQDIINILDKNLEQALFSLDAYIENSENSLKTIEEARKCKSCGVGRMTLKLGKFGAFLGCSNYPECNNIAKIGEEQQTEEEKQEQLQNKFEDTVVAQDPNTKGNILLKKGPYGFYLELAGSKVESKTKAGKKSSKPKRVGIPKKINVDKLTPEQAISLINLPRIVGQNPESGENILANIGRFGPYVGCGKNFASITFEQLFTISQNDALAAIEEKKAKSKS